MIQAVVLDLDGTLLDHHHQIPPLNRDVLNALKEKGVRIYIATGRTFLSMKPYYDQLNLDTPAISYNGAKVVYKDGRIEESGLTHQQVHFLIELFF